MRTNWKLIAACLLCVLAAHAQYTTIGSSDAPADSLGVLNAKVAFTVQSTQPSTCARGKEVWIDSDDGKWYACTSTDTFSEMMIFGQTYTNPSTITSLAYAKITGVPSFLTAVPAPGASTLGGVVSGQCTTTTGKLMGYDTSGARICESDQTSGSGSGITSLNGLTGSTQTFGAIGTTGTAPNWVSSGTAHTLHIPLASAAGVTAGLVTKTWWDSVPTLGAANTYSAGFKQTFTSSASTAAVNYAPYAGDPSSLFDGDAWYNSATGLFKARIASTTKTFLFTDGNAATATALAANGANCPAGSYALGVDASGAAEGCTDVATPLAAKAPLTGGGTSGTWPIGVTAMQEQLQRLRPTERTVRPATIRWAWMPAAMRRVALRTPRPPARPHILRA
jgi:hypothetical protein